MSDIQTLWNTATMRGDWAVANGALVSSADVETAVLISLFTDRLALADDQIPDAPQLGMANRRGWWGDQDPNYLIGSRLWLLDRVKGPLNVAQRAEDYAKEALQWMLDDGVVAKFDIKATWVPLTRLDLVVVAHRKDGSVISNQSINVW
jgi:phage gp46-like protein